MAPPSSGKSIPRHELIAAALELGIQRPESLTEAQLMTEIRRVSEGTRAVAPEFPTGGGWLGVARHLVTSVVEQGLNLPSAARAIRDSVRPRSTPAQRPPLPTVTLAQIYISQGHDARAITTLREVLRRDPVHPKAQRLLSELLAKDESDTSAATAAQPPEFPASQDMPPAPEHARPAAEGDAGLSGDEAAPPPVSDVAPRESSTPNGSQGSPAATTAAEEEQDDGLLVFRQSEGAAVYWELGRRGLAARRRGARLEMRIVTFTPDARGALAEEQCQPIGDVSGCFRVQCHERAVVRAALGIQQDERWFVLRVASGLVVQAEVGELETEFRPRKHPLDPALVERGRLLVVDGGVLASAS